MRAENIKFAQSFTFVPGFFQNGGLCPKLAFFGRKHLTRKKICQQFLTAPDFKCANAPLPAFCRDATDNTRLYDDAG